MIAILSVILSLSSTLGPTLGGFLTDTLSWHWLFLVNIVPGLVVAAVVWVTIDIDKPDFSLLRDFDLPGMLLMAALMKLGSLPTASDPLRPTRAEIAATQKAVADYQKIFNTH